MSPSKAPSLQWTVLRWLSALECVGRKRKSLYCKLFCLWIIWPPSWTERKSCSHWQTSRGTTPINLLTQANWVPFRQFAGDAARASFSVGLIINIIIITIPPFSHCVGPHSQLALAHRPLKSVLILLNRDGYSIEFHTQNSMQEEASNSSIQ